MSDYVYPSVYFSYFLFFLLTVGAIILCVRSLKDGYFGRDGEAVKYQMLKDEDDAEPRETDEQARRGGNRHDR